jgi:hypothetical protein
MIDIIERYQQIERVVYVEVIKPVILPKAVLCGSKHFRKADTCVLNVIADLSGEKAFH